jgi:hypothetical protein
VAVAVAARQLAGATATSVLGPWQLLRQLAATGVVFDSVAAVFAIGHDTATATATDTQPGSGSGSGSGSGIEAAFPNAAIMRGLGRPRVKALRLSAIAPLPGATATASATATATDTNGSGSGSDSGSESDSDSDTAAIHSPTGSDTGSVAGSGIDSVNDSGSGIGTGSGTGSGSGGGSGSGMAWGEADPWALAGRVAKPWLRHAETLGRFADYDAVMVRGSLTVAVTLAVVVVVRRVAVAAWQWRSWIRSTGAVILTPNTAGVAVAVAVVEGLALPRFDTAMFEIANFDTG